jgi:hypothetical protein
MVPPVAERRQDGSGGGTDMSQLRAAMLRDFRQHSGRRLDCQLPRSSGFAGALRFFEL